MTPDLIATVKLYPTGDGGRQGPTPSNFLGCIFEFEGGLFECRLLLTDIGSLAPGQQARVPIKLLSPDLLRGKLHRGDTFRLRESRPIGEGTIEDGPLLADLSAGI